MFLVSSCSCLCPIHWSQVLGWEWRCSWSCANRWCSNYMSAMLQLHLSDQQFYCLCVILEAWRYTQQDNARDSIQKYTYCKNLEENYNDIASYWYCIMPQGIILAADSSSFEYHKLISSAMIHPTTIHAHTTNHVDNSCSVWFCWGF